jgi:septal ring factor EnvC (AmiA/AmiB activator)
MNSKGAEMKRYRIVGLIAILFVILHADQIPAQQSPTVSSTTNSMQAQPDPNEEIKTLKTEVQVMRDYNDDFLSTVHWTLTIVAAIVLALISFSWFVNFKMAGRERETLKAELSASLQEDLARQVLQIQSQIPQQVQAAIQLATAQLEMKLLQLGNDIKDLEHQFRHAKCDLLKQEAKDWESQGILANAVGAYARMGIMASELKYEPTVNEALESIRRLLKTGAEPGTAWTRTLTELLDKLPKEYATDVEALRTLLQRARS